MLFVIVMNAMAQTEKFCIASKGRTATIVVDDNDWKGVLRAANNLGDDVRKVSGTAAPVVESAAVPQQPQQPASIIAGTIGKSRLVDRLRRDEVFDNIRWLEVNFPNASPGNHKLKLIMIDPEIVIETIVVNPDNNRYSYFGAPAR